uniref:Uracil phosphoribosyltransferase homolog n=1 Tax=Rhabditophanes sp. KR3021 TaxID=114890 RepID=A0AC35U3Q0_9BILA
MNSYNENSSHLENGLNDDEDDNNSLYGIEENEWDDETKIRSCSFTWTANIIVMKKTDSIVELQTILRDKETTHSDFIFHADRLIRLVVEEGLNQLPYKETTVMTPSGDPYSGIKFVKGNIGVSVCRSGECMEEALRQCCRSIRIGKILLSDKHRVLYSRFSPDIKRRHVLLCYPLLGSGVTVIEAIKLLLENDVKEEKIIVLSIFASGKAIKSVSDRFLRIRIVTSEVCGDEPFDFTKKYFGTD